MGNVVLKNEDEFKKSLAHRKGEEYKEEEKEVKEEEEEESTNEGEQGEGGAEEEEGKTEDEKKNEKGVDFEALFLEEKKKREELLEKVMKGNKGDEKPPEEPIKPPAAVTLLSENDLDDEKFTEVLSDKRRFIEVLNEVGNKAFQKAYEEALKVVPEVANNVAAFRVTLSELNRSFFERHPELAKMRKFVSSVADEVIIQEGINDLNGYEKMLEHLPQRVQEKLSELGIDAKAVSSTEPNKPNTKKPSTPAKPGGQRRKPSPEDLDDLSDDLKRSLAFVKKRKGLA